MKRYIPFFLIIATLFTCSIFAMDEQQLKASADQLLAKKDTPASYQELKNQIVQARQLMADPRLADKKTALTAMVNDQETRIFRIDAQVADLAKIQNFGAKFLQEISNRSSNAQYDMAGSAAVRALGVNEAGSDLGYLFRYAASANHAAQDLAQAFPDGKYQVNIEQLKQLNQQAINTITSYLDKKITAASANQSLEARIEKSKELFSISGLTPHPTSANGGHIVVRFNAGIEQVVTHLETEIDALVANAKTPEAIEKAAIIGRKLEELKTSIIPMINDRNQAFLQGISDRIDAQRKKAIEPWMSKQIDETLAEWNAEKCHSVPAAKEGIRQLKSLDRSYPDYPEYPALQQKVDQAMAQLTNRRVDLYADAWEKTKNLTIEKENEAWHACNEKLWSIQKKKPSDRTTKQHNDWWHEMYNTDTYNRYTVLNECKEESRKALATLATKPNDDLRILADAGYDQPADRFEAIQTTIKEESKKKVIKEILEKRKNIFTMQGILSRLWYNIPDNRKPLVFWGYVALGATTAATIYGSYKGIKWLQLSRAKKRMQVLIDEIKERDINQEVDKAEQERWRKLAMQLPLLSSVMKNELVIYLENYCAVPSELHRKQLLQFLKQPCVQDCTEAAGFAKRKGSKSWFDALKKAVFKKRKKEAGDADEHVE